jgi:hypothetical protein
MGVLSATWKPVSLGHGHWLYRYPERGVGFQIDNESRDCVNAAARPNLQHVAGFAHVRQGFTGHGRPMHISPIQNQHDPAVHHAQQMGDKGDHL